uniref:Pept_C1 domain-containing protein n=1 Tax=Panagrellus redivivus TaxID=6233 RepID=A0A7E4URH6_PANRE
MNRKKEEFSHPATSGMVLPSSRDSGCSSRKWFCIGVALFLVLGVALTVAGLGAYLQHEGKRKVTKETHAYMRSLVNQINNAPDVRWKAKFNPFATRTHDYNYKTLKNSTAIKEYIATIEEMFESDKMKEHIKQLEELPDKELPKNFDARDKWPQCPTLSTIPNQGGCGSCFAVSAVGVASDRSCIQSNGTLKAWLSVEDVLGCCAVCGNCYGGDPLKALVYWAKEGIVTGGRDGCRPYHVDLECGTPCSPAAYPEAEYRRTCIRRCQGPYYKNKYDDDKYFGSMAYTMYPRRMTVDNAGKERIEMPSIIGKFNDTSMTPLTLDEVRTIIKKELYLFGPTTMAFPVTEEFLHYESGIFHPYPADDFEKRIVYWHVVRVIGWGTDDDGNHYWTAINSFGSHWGDNGIFHIDTSLLEKFGLEYETAML